MLLYGDQLPCNLPVHVTLPHIVVISLITYMFGLFVYKHCKWVLVSEPLQNSNEYLFGDARQCPVKHSY